MPTPMQHAALLAALKREKLDHWRPALEACPPPRARHACTVYHVWARMPRGKPRQPVGEVNAVQNESVYHVRCWHPRCHHVSSHRDFAPAVTHLLRNMEQNGLLPMTPPP